MGGIICAIRGGPNSQPTIERAVALAKETGQPLYFLYVVNLGFMSHTSSARVHTISEEMDQMGDFILLMAKDEAARQGVEAQGVIRHGNVLDEIVALCRELQAGYLVLGHPKIGREDTVFTHEQLQRFVARIEEQTGAKVVLAGEAVP